MIICERTGQEVGQAQHQQHDERHAAQHAARVETHLAQELLPGRGRGECRNHAWQVRAGGTDRDGIRSGQGRLAAPSTAAAAAALAAEQGKGGGKQQRGHAQPQRAVGQQVASQFRNAAVAFSGGPVADGAAQRAHAQRLAQHRDPRIVDVSQQGGAGAEQHQVGDQADVHPQDRAGQCRQQ
ncbi:hypothetical protein G6F22_018683 [Rhizopus arrhizus]|nr:hypothetical protein G6F22_018683 [Rhizopus arrhizus]